jgi:ribose transport system permease protein
MADTLTTETAAAAPAQAPAPGVTPRGGGQWPERFAKSALVAVFVAMVAVFVILRPNTFATQSNLAVIINSSAVLMIFGCAVTVVLLCGEFDLAFPYIADAVAVTIGVLVTVHGMHSGVAVVAAVGIGVVVATLFGIGSGAALAIGRVPSFVATLAIGSVAAGFELAVQGKIAGGLKQISTLSLPLGIQKLGTETFFGTAIRLTVVVAIVVVGAVWLLLRFSVLGRHIYAVGGNADAAFLAAVPVTRVRILVFALSGALAGIAGVVGLADHGYFNGSSPPLLLQSYTVAFLGTAVFALRRFTIGGTVVAVLFLQTLTNGLSLLNQPTWIVSMVNGSVLLTAVVLTRRRGRQ